jgi:isoleucyl-tRNA synthetase
MYQNLVRSVDEDAPESVHHTEWPEADEKAIDEALLAQMALTRQLVTQGHSCRASKNVKLRQPLSRALVHLEGGAPELSAELVALVQDELNVKEVTFVETAEELVTYRLLPDNKVLGPRFGKQFPAIRTALSELDPAAAVKRLRASLPLRLEVASEEIELAPEEVLIQEQPQEGLAVASDRGVTVGVDVVLTPELAAEGLARDYIPGRGRAGGRHRGMSRSRRCRDPEHRTARRAARRRSHGEPRSGWRAQAGIECPQSMMPECRGNGNRDR